MRVRLSVFPESVCCCLFVGFSGVCVLSTPFPQLHPHSVRTDEGFQQVIHRVIIVRAKSYPEKYGCFTAK